MIDLMNYHNEFSQKENPNNVIRDVFDGTNYRNLQGKNVAIGERTYDHKFFDDPRDIALGLSTDGFAPFKKRKQTCWPILLFNYNLPPEIRFHIHRILCAGVVPGPRKPKEFDSFLWPLVEELLEAAAGATTFDSKESILFQLHVYLIILFGNMPAMAMVMRMKGHNGLKPCRSCYIQGVLAPHGGKTYYVPLYRPWIADNSEICTYDPACLPLRTHAKFMEDARHVQFADSEAEESRRAKQCGVKGVPLLSCLPSINFPSSFPLDFMHLIYENLIKNLVLLWTGQFKGLDEGDGSYTLSGTVWEAIGSATAKSGSTIPSAYGARPQNVADNKSACTADAWSFWTLYIGPILLHQRFIRAVYYDHFISLVKLINLCLQFEVSQDELSVIRIGFQDWVKKYEKLYYQYQPSRLSACPLTVHALLHIADGIETNGPVWAYWAFPMERYCGLLGPAIKSRRFPYANLDNYVVDSAQISQIKNVYNLEDALNLNVRKNDKSDEFRVPGYDFCILMYPRIQRPTILRGLQSKIFAALATRYNTSANIVQKIVSLDDAEIWGKMRLLEGGDTIRASEVGSNDAEDTRDATFVRYQLYVDRHTRKRKNTPEYTLETFYGQLQTIFKIGVPASDHLDLREPEILLLGAIRGCKLEKSNPFKQLDMHPYKSLGSVDIVDIQTIHCLVGRVFDRGCWVIIDRSGKLARAEAEDLPAVQDALD